MKTIELTTRQQHRLIRMTVSLFPNREWEYLQQNINNTPIGVLFHKTTKTEKYTYPKITLPWVEFCIFYLIPKLKRKLKIEISISITEIVENDQNLIDVIYENYYKQLKK